MIHFLGSMIPENFVKFYGTPFSARCVNLGMERSLMTIFLSLLRLRPTFIYPDKQLAAILDRILLQFHVSPTQLAAFIPGPEAKMEGQKPPHGSLQGFGTGSTKLATFEEFVFFFICEQAGGIWPVALAGFQNPTFSVWLRELYVTSQIPFAQEYWIEISHRKGISEYFVGNPIACQARTRRH